MSPYLDPETRKEAEFEFIKTRIENDLLNAGRVEDARELYDWLAVELNKRMGVYLSELGLLDSKEAAE